ncbi:hypothetical protein BD560DRAFT_429206 [Blakeslea trispora]|nr:hypothetical protein BD560DRAFT_429206 [Blakeslea trispora]
MLKRKSDTTRDIEEERRLEIINKCNRYLLGYFRGSSLTCDHLVKILQDENFWLKNQTVCAYSISQASALPEPLQGETSRRKTSKVVKRVTFAPDVAEIEEEKEEEAQDELTEGEEEDEHFQDDDFIEEVARLGI